MDNISKSDGGKLFVKGHVLISDITTALNDPVFGEFGEITNGIVELDKSNAIHPENMSLALSNAMSGITGSNGKNYGAISEMRFGNGGTVIMGNSRVTYRKPRTTAVGGLYTETYAKKINGNINTGIDTAFNYVTPYHIPGQIFSDIVCVCTLGLNEPADQNASSSTELNGKYAFNELALYTDAGSPLTHIVFYPVEKTANKVLQIKYTIRIQLM